MTPREPTGVSLEVYTQALLDTVEALRVHFAPAFERLNRDLAKVQGEIEAEERRRRHPRITDNLHKLHRRYRRPS